MQYLYIPYVHVYKFPEWRKDERNISRRPVGKRKVLSYIYIYIYVRQKVDNNSFNRTM